MSDVRLGIVRVACVGMLGVGLVACANNIWTVAPQGPTIHVDVASRCPTALAGQQDVSNSGSGLDTHLAPPNPVRGLICRYGARAGPVTSATGALYRSTALDARSAAALAAAIDAVSIVPPSGTTSCPADFDSASMIVLAYVERSDVDLWYADSGCKTLDNGRVRAFEPGNPRFYGQLEAMIDHLSPPRVS